MRAASRTNAPNFHRFATGSVMAALATLALLWSAAAAAEGWAPAVQRQQALVRLADKHNLPRASAQTIARLQTEVPALRGIDPARIRVVSYRDPAYQAWAQEAGQRPLIGLASTPHKGGPHPHFLGYQPPAKGELGAYTWIIDGIQPGWMRPDPNNPGRQIRSTFHDGSMMRREPLDRTHGGSGRLLCFWEGPKQAVAAQGQKALDIYHRDRQVGQSCAYFATGMLAELGRATAKDPHNPLGRLRQEGWPAAAVKGALGAAPDMIVHAVPGDVPTVTNERGQRLAGPEHQITIQY